MTSPRYRHIGRLTYLFVSIAVAIATVASAYGGTVNPDVTTIPAILAMTFPGWLILTVVLLVISLIFYRKSALIQLLTVAVAFPSILTVAPLNLVSPKLTAEEKERTFTFMTYNTFDLTDWTKLDEGPWERERWQREAEAGAVNKTISTIIKAQPDLMCAQEIAQILSPERSVSWLHFTEGQADTLGHMLPNRCGVGSELIFSRFPLQQIELRQPKSSCGIFCGATTEIFGQKILVVSIHLESIGLSDQDKALFKELTEGEARTKKDLKRVKSQLLSKLSVAFKERASQATSTIFPAAMQCASCVAMISRQPLAKQAKYRSRPTTPTVSISISTTFFTAATCARSPTAASARHIPTTTPWSRNSLSPGADTAPDCGR